MYDEYGFTTEPETSSSGFGDFFSSARNRVASFLTPLTSSPAVQNAGGQLMDAIYQYGRGRIDTAREKLVNSFLMTSEGRKLQREGVRQTAMQNLPIIIAAVAGLAILGFFLARR